MSNLQKYGSYDVDAAEEEQKDIDSSKGADFMKLATGKNVVRFLPPPPGKRSPFRVVHQHFIELPGGQKLTFACPRMEAKQFCPACQKAEALRKTGNPADRDLAYSYFPKRRVFANVINRKEPEKGVQVLGFGKQIHEALIQLRKDEDAGGDFTHPDSGFDIIIERQGTGKNDTNYTVMASRRQSVLGNMEWLDQQHDLDRFGAVKTDEELSAMLRGEEPQKRGNGGGGRVVDGQVTARGGAPKGRQVSQDIEDVDEQDGDAPF